MQDYYKRLRNWQLINAAIRGFMIVMIALAASSFIGQGLGSMPQSEPAGERMGVNIEYDVTYIVLRRDLMAGGKRQLVVAKAHQRGVEIYTALPCIAKLANSTVFRLTPGIVSQGPIVHVLQPANTDKNAVSPKWAPEPKAPVPEANPPASGSRLAKGPS